MKMNNIVILLSQHKLHERTQREAQRLAASRQSARGLSPLGNKHKNTRTRINSLRVILYLFKLLVASRVKGQTHLSSKGKIVYPQPPNHIIND